MRSMLRGPAPWAVILCRFRDVGIPDIPRSRFFEMVTEYGTGGLFDYWQDNSHGRISTTGSEVFGWYTMNYSYVNDSNDPLHAPTDTRTPRRKVWIDEARRLAAADGVDLSRFHGVIAVINGPGDSSNIGTDMVMNVWGPWGQWDWRWCSKCEGLAYAGSGRPGSCPAGGRHEHTGSNNYALPMNDASYPGQPNWRWCSKCQGLAFAGIGPGSCPAGGAHDTSTSADYRLATPDAVGHPGQEQWKWCNKCQGLSFAGNPSPGACPAGGTHDHTGSSNYLLSSVNTGLDLTYTAHETGHGYGLEHSWMGNPDVVYGDRWDIMSAMNVQAFARAPYANCGPNLNAPKRHKFGWLPDSRVVSYRPSSVTIRGGIEVTINALDRIEGDNPLMARVITPDRIYSVEYRRPVGWDVGIGGEAVLIHEQRSLYTAGQGGWRWCDRCQGLFYAGVALCPAGSTHDHSGSAEYVLNDTSSGAGQSNWRWCSKCQQVTFAGAADMGPCAAGGEHDHAGSTDYRIAPTGGQTGWKWCRKCQALTYTKSTKVGACPGGGVHDHDGSNDYAVPGPPAAGQGGWRWCKRCQGLSFIGFSRCAAGGSHTWWGSYDYSLASAPTQVKDGQTGWRWCSKCYQLWYAGGGGAGVCAAGGGHTQSGSSEYTLPTATSGMLGQADWRACSKCQTLAFNNPGGPGACPAGGQHDHTQSSNYVLANPGDDLVYLLGGARRATDVFDDEARYVHIAVLGTDPVAGTARIQLGHPITNRGVLPIR